MHTLHFRLPHLERVGTMTELYSIYLESVVVERVTHLGSFSPEHFGGHFNLFSLDNVCRH